MQDVVDDKIYKIVVDIIDLKAGFVLANFFIRSDFFCSKTMTLLFTSKKAAKQCKFSKKLLCTKKLTSGKPA